MDEDQFLDHLQQFCCWWCFCFIRHQGWVGAFVGNFWLADVTPLCKPKKCTPPTLENWIQQRYLEHTSKSWSQAAQNLENQFWSNHLRRIPSGEHKNKIIPSILYQNTQQPQNTYKIPHTISNHNDTNQLQHHKNRKRMTVAFNGSVWGCCQGIVELLPRLTSKHIKMLQDVKVMLLS